MADGEATEPRATHIRKYSLTKIKTFIINYGVTLGI